MSAQLGYADLETAVGSIVVAVSHNGETPNPKDPVGVLVTQVEDLGTHKVVTNDAVQWGIGPDGYLTVE